MGNGKGKQMERIDTTDSAVIMAALRTYGETCQKMARMETAEAETCAPEFKESHRNLAASWDMYRESAARIADRISWAPLEILGDDA